MQDGLNAFHRTIIHAHHADLAKSLVPVRAADLPPPEVLGFRIIGDPEMAMRVIWMSDDRRSAMMIERCGPCTIVGRHFNDVFYLLRGRWTGKRPDGTSYEARAGDFLCFSEGDLDEAVVHETFLKCSFYHSARPLPFEVTPLA